MYDLGRFTEDELCGISSKLNHWEWDERLGEKPRDWDRRKNVIIRRIREAILERVGRYKVLQWHQIHNCGMTKEESDEWLLKELAEIFLT